MSKVEVRKSWLQDVFDGSFAVARVTKKFLVEVQKYDPTTTFEDLMGEVKVALKNNWNWIDWYKGKDRI